MYLSNCAYHHCARGHRKRRRKFITIKNSNRFPSERCFTNERDLPPSFSLSLPGGFFFHVCFFSFFKPRANFLRFCFAVSHQHFTQKFTRHIIIITHTGITLIITVASENHGRSVTTHTTHADAVSRHPSTHPGWREGGKEGRRETPPIGY